MRGSLLVFALLIILLSNVNTALAQENNTLTNCPTQEMIEGERSNCNTNGGTSYEVSRDNCVYIECKYEDESTTVSDCLSEEQLLEKEKTCMSSGGNSLRTSIDNCVIIECAYNITSATRTETSMVSNCLTEEQLLERERNCINIGGKSLRTSKDNCISIECENGQETTTSSTTCLTKEQLVEKEKTCMSSGGNAIKNSRDNCLYIDCQYNQTEFQCPSEEARNEERNKCKANGGLVFEVNNNNCMVINCNFNNQAGACPSEEMKKDESARCASNGGTPEEKTGSNGCSFIACNYVPVGCAKVVDDKGMVIIKCEQAMQNQCPDAKILEDKKSRCVSQGGFAEFNTDNTGCNYINCRFDNNNVNASSNLFIKMQCPSEEEITMTMNKCSSVNLTGKIIFENGCKFAKCIEERVMYCPENQDPSIKESILKNCNGKIVTGFDDRGCSITKCESKDYCSTVPKEAISECEKYGGQMVTKTDDNGCVTYTKCIQRGESSQAYVDPVTEIPSSTKLLQVALALETLVMKIDTLARQTDDIASYYASLGSSDEQRFRTVAGMFRGVIDKINTLKKGIRDNLTSMSTSYMEQVKQDIKYIKDVVLMDIVYVMLSSSEDYTPPERNATSSSTDCITEQCFNDAFRVCKPIVYNPGGKGEVKATIIGVENDTCVIKAFMLEENVSSDLASELGVSAPYEMTCRKTDYAFGFNTELDVSTYCEGNLVKILGANQEGNK